MDQSGKFSYMHLGNIALIEEMRALYLEDPEQIDPSWRYFFEGMDFSLQAEGAGQKNVHTKDLAVINLIDAYRRFGHLKAAVNPIATTPPAHPPELDLKMLGFSTSDLKEPFPTFDLLEAPMARLEEIIEVLEKIYCGSIGIEYQSRHSPELEHWLQGKIESTRFSPNFSVDQKKSILHYLNKAELFEIFLHTKYVGQKRFSLEGGETLIPILQEILSKGAAMEADEFVIGMAHRGRLNVLANILQKSFSMIFSEFEDYFDPTLTEASGDVKYHRGFSANVETTTGKQVHISLTANPSHLESVDPVVEGKVKAKQIQRDEGRQQKIVPIVIHGDSSVAGQGVVYETLQLSQVNGYSTGGTIHIVVHNQIGFTTLPHEYRSSRYSTDVATGFGIPVFHVNAEDPEGCVLAAELACEIRHRFGCDVFIEMNCYRKYGHNEGDEPAFTQPLQYQMIKQKQSIRELYREQLLHQGVLEKQVADDLEEEFKKELHFELQELKISKERSETEAFGGLWQNYEKIHKKTIFDPIKTSVSLSLLREVCLSFCTVPDDLNIHSKLKRVIDQRKGAIQKDSNVASVDWSLAEHLAFASLLCEGVHVRLSGQDCLRGTFTQRHSVWVDQNDGRRYFPLSNVCSEQAACTIYNSPLSEFAVLGFEFGYSLSYPSALVLWEAQFGDFANGAQVIFDQYISSSEQKWSRYSGLVILLPHGFEGQGPEHSSGRIERFLQLSAETNMQVVYPTTPAQYFHLLRRQVKRAVRLPLVVFTPKGLLRHPKCLSPLEDFSGGTFQEILDDPAKDKKQKRILFCSGRIYYDLLAEREKRELDHVAIIRVEQLYPFHHELFSHILEKYTQASEFYWVQEEPRNMGAWSYVAPVIQKRLSKGHVLHYVGRSRAASPATGSHKAHKKEQEEIMEIAFDKEAL